MKKIKCCLCGTKFSGYGNNPYPLCKKDDFDSRCCNDCNMRYVVPVRFASYDLKLSDNDYETIINNIHKIHNYKEKK